jgi:aspartyl-tRNA(Asn)/glutamyl-tRNA(Gln) amidotransferase subunit C
MALGPADVDKIAHLARLALTDGERASLAQEISGILDLVEQMNAVTTAGVEPMAHPLDMAQRLRADAVTEDDRRDDYQQIAPAVENGLYLVPKVIE